MKRHLVPWLLYFFDCLLLLSTSSSILTVQSNNPLVQAAVEEEDKDINNMVELLANDPELRNALEIFMAMSPEEREVTIQGFRKTIISGIDDGDPTQTVEMERLMEVLSQVETEEDTSSLQQLIQQDEFRKAQQNARQHLDGMDWDAFWSRQADILEATLASGQLTPEQAAEFRTNPKAWEAQLRTIYTDLHQQQ
jgi:hypothetical protein